MIPLFATEMATRAFPSKHSEVHESHYRHLDDLIVSSIGFGARMGDADDETDSKIMEALSLYLRKGGNLIDTAIVDRHQRSERAIGESLARTLSTGQVSRREVVVCTKIGFIPYDGSPAKDRRAYIKETYVESGITTGEEIAGMMHCISTSFLADQLSKSRKNLQLETIDLLYLHNPEAQVSYVGREIVLERIKKAIEFLEEAASDGLIRRYGVSTWTGFRVPNKESNHLELSEIVNMAESVAGSKHHFRVIQVPYNPAMPGAAFSMTQETYGNSMSILEAAHELGIDVTIASPLMQGNLASELPQSFHHAFPRFPADAQRAIDFEVSTPWVTSVIVGMKEKDHIEENCRIMLDPALTALQWAAEVDQLQDV